MINKNVKVDNPVVGTNDTVEMKTVQASTDTIAEMPVVKRKTTQGNTGAGAASPDAELRRLYSSPEWTQLRDGTSVKMRWIPDPKLVAIAKERDIGCNSRHCVLVGCTGGLLSGLAAYVALQLSGSFVLSIALNALLFLAMSMFAVPILEKTDFWRKPKERKIYKSKKDVSTEMYMMAHCLMLVVGSMVILLLVM